MAPRHYASPIRDAQLGRTRDRLLATTYELLAAGGLDALTLPKVAQAAGFSVPTVYRHFPTLDDLLRGFLLWIRPQLGQTADRLLGIRAADLPRLPIENFARYEQHAAVLQALIESRAWNQIRVASMSDRAARGAEVLREVAPKWPAGDLEAVAGAIYVLNSPQAWRWMRETWGLDSPRAARAASWAIKALIAALPESRGLGSAPKPRVARRRPRSKRSPQ